MSEQSYSNPPISSQLSIQQAALLKPFSWLAQGWQDIRRHPQASLAHGLAVSALILITLIITSIHIYVIAAVVSGFMLIGPIMAAGLCELSRRDEKDEPTSFDDSLDGLRHCQSTLNHLAGILLSFSVLWFVISGLVLFLTVGDIAPSLELTLWGDFLSYVTPSQIALYTVVGGLLASIVFVVTVVSVPAIIENDIPAVDAMILSFKVTIANLPTMIVWSSLIVILTVIGFTTFLVGMIVIYPLLGHATWHAYRDLVESKT
ncbi:hypothetical protein A9Q79_02040 [Methylophaga sp. 42_25_T18]|nr:hypothetical protein A9Q79_02040 [Methylophaga sp. 42_25_T18]OUR88791.1 hypothetical protein A9Q92_02275 [Methylophaga sp. 42_8_T64]